LIGIEEDGLVEMNSFEEEEEKNYVVVVFFFCCETERVMGEWKRLVWYLRERNG
jgi:hypothetical protein